MNSSRFQRTTWKERICYGFGDMGVNLVWILPSSYLMLYYTDAVHINAAFIGTMMLLCRLFDGISDIIMGIIIDNTHSKLGKARPWLIYMSLPLMLSIFLVFHIPASFNALGQKIYSFVTYFVMSVVCYTAVNLSYHAMLPRFSLTSQDRSIVSVIRSVFSLIITIVVSTVTTMILAKLGGETSQRAWTILVIIYAVIAELAIILTVTAVKEKTELLSDENVKKEKVPTIEAVKYLLSSRYFYISVYIFFAFYIANGTSGIMVYYARDVFGNADLMGLISIASILPIMLFSPVCPALFKRFGKRNTMLVGMIIAACASAAILISPKNLVFYLALSFVKSAASAPLMSAMYTMAGDIVDYTQWKHGVRTEGIATSVNSIGMKLGTGVGSAILGWMLVWGHYDSTLSVQPDSAINAMIFVSVVLPIFIYGTAALALVFWDIEKYQAEMADAVKAE